MIQTLLSPPYIYYLGGVVALLAVILCFVNVNLTKKLTSYIASLAILGLQLDF